jgi:hypothetical protein
MEKNGENEKTLLASDVLRAPQDEVDSPSLDTPSDKFFSHLVQISGAAFCSARRKLSDKHRQGSRLSIKTSILGSEKGLLRASSKGK